MSIQKTSKIQSKEILKENSQVSNAEENISKETSLDNMKQQTEMSADDLLTEDTKNDISTETNGKTEEKVVTSEENLIIDGEENIDNGFTNIGDIPTTLPEYNDSTNVDDSPELLPNVPSEAVGFQAVNSDGDVIGFISKTELIQECKNALYQDLAILEQNRPTFLPADDMANGGTTLATATDQYEDELPIKSDAPYVRGLDALGNPIRISKADLASVVGGLLESTNAYPFMDRGTIRLTNGINLVKYIQDNRNDMKIGTYIVIGISSSNVLTDWGDLIKFSPSTFLFYGLNSKKQLLIYNDVTHLMYTEISGKLVEGPF